MSGDYTKFSMTIPPFEQRWFRSVPRPMVRGDLVSSSFYPWAQTPPAKSWGSIDTEYGRQKVKVNVPFQYDVKVDVGPMQWSSPFSDLEFDYELQRAVLEEQTKQRVRAENALSERNKKIVELEREIVGLEEVLRKIQSTADAALDGSTPSGGTDGG